MGSSTKRTSWWQTAAALVPCAMIAGAWGAAVAMPGQVSPVDSAAYSAYAEESPEVPVTGPQLEVSPLQDPVEQQSKSNLLTPAALPNAPSDIPTPALLAYQRAASVMAATKPECKLTWPLLAAIGRVESNHGQFGGATVTSTGATTRAIIGIPLDGTNNTATIADTDKGAWDGDTKWDRAVGPMQFIPSTWASVGVDADGDGKSDPNNINDAALGAAVYLCVGGHDLSTDVGARAALLSYNRSTAYADQVLTIARSYATSNPLAVLPGFPYPTTPGAPLGPIGTQPPLGSVPGGPGAGGSQPTPLAVIGIEKPPTPAPVDEGGLVTKPTPKPTKPTPTKPTKPTPTKPTTPTPTPTDPTTTPTPTPTDPTTTPTPTEPSPTPDPTPTEPTGEPTPSDPTDTTEPTPPSPSPTGPTIS
ncbi:lytic transglycosylase domain-containing protein [Mumia qirimensis]|uniref:lytic transglycosylase domain-containing protein n=1 Tax=Mumia qirimensis TaxID=3234852 RepID=UPI00351CF145